MTTQESREQEIKRLNAEKVKQIALCHFYSYYVRHNMSDMLAYVGEDVTWLGSQSDFVAHNRQEFENLLEREIKKSTKAMCYESDIGRCQSGFRKLLSGDRRIGTASAGAG